jgi:hypothetical protein
MQRLDLVFFLDRERSIVMNNRSYAEYLSITSTEYRVNWEDYSEIKTGDGNNRVSETYLEKVESVTNSDLKPIEKEGRLKQ